ncbi:histamine N-methyltransferase-like [Saccoglossus kowalevskii]|uniref:Histamine N-methyltransferase-like n=1 Tax=Saccoglossus kowalevskii TaxID=10224 RepID=A0ABM0M3V2_SACKO|nr:PREDICTED: histamine N-methyltransferase-like [Saccoglossus kowalevskii]
MSYKTSIYEDVNYYFKCFNIFLAKAKCEGADMWNRQWAGLLAQFQFNADEEIRMLTIGAGAGYRECLIIQHLLKRHSSIHITVVEPAQKPIDEFKIKAAKITKEFPGVSFEWHIQTFENYQKDHRVSDDVRDGSFHLVFAGHSLYYMDDWQYALDGMYSHVQSGGILVVTVIRGQAGAGRLAKMYRKLEGCSLNLQTSDDVKHQLKKTNSEQMIDQNMYREDAYDISDVFDESSVVGNLLLDFLIQRRDFRMSAPHGHLEKVLQFLRENSVQENGKYWFYSDEEDVVAKK